MNKQKFKKAKPLKITVDGKPLTAEVKTFKSGTLGWAVQDYIDIIIDGETFAVQINLNATISGTK